MALALNEEQRILKDSARDFLNENAPVEALRKLRDEKDATGYSTDLWQQMVELGWTAVAIPEQFGGLEFGLQGLGSIFQEMGQNLTASPLFSSVVLSAAVIELLGTAEQAENLLPEVITGETTLALALEETNRHAPTNISTSAEKSDDGFTLNGAKTFVLDGHTATKLLVVARTSGDKTSQEGLSVFLVDPSTAGVSITRTFMMDSRNAANVTLDNVKVSADTVVGELDNAYPALDKALDRGRAILAAEMLGGCLEMFQRTVEYLKEREQFGVKIGTFQALKHRASQMFVEIELSKSLVLNALTAIDEDREDAAEAVTMAKAKLNDTYQLVTNEATQMHGGIGVTDELDVGLFLKRARVSIHALGDSPFMRDRLATLKGY
ncbi:Caffeyl-CoA reductase-Etf complex subunit CarC [BD1-7 clade bacterium]|uniref:Caffeyl-CoA reductase-Etf complex subunit CarC n=1 Tax=BD1-7 clade bacterium TaxID=2029982 RepID=A0A5S9QQS7_9GAMM|nr:Caffeyl-CoA reductase-Etf complex subunit CarC [BD1-7 clade bacterium]CAA0120528.1 Caffeyl-CoA reductase-Etf complex subunit CarC [BD1-7 clade bacterium]